MSRRGVTAAVGLAVIWLVTTVVAATLGFTHDSRTVIVGAHTTTVRPTLDSYARLDFGPILPRFRVPMDAPLGIGVLIRVGDTEASSLDEIIQRDALIASQPRGEIARIRSTVGDMAASNLLQGAGIATLVCGGLVVAWRLVGGRRREEIATYVRTYLHEPRRHLMPLTTGLLVGSVGVVAIVVPGHEDDERATPEEWQTMGEAFPGLDFDERLAAVQVTTGPATAGAQALVESAIVTYSKSVDFYGELEERVRAEVPDQVRRPEEDETVALLVSDRHDNIGMDPVARAVADAGGATVLIDAGDDTSTGGEWEAFSINSLADAFEGFDVVSVGGNHDQGDFVTELQSDRGFTVLDGEPEEVAGIRFLGASDPRSSGLTAIREEGEETIEEQSARLAEVACEDGEVDILVVHSPTTDDDAVEAGCVDLALSGHIHRQGGPTTTPVDGRPVTTYSNGTTGGAAFALALGSALRRAAQVTLITFRDGEPVGIQPVTFATTGEITVEEYIPVPVPPADPLRAPGRERGGAR